MLSILLGQAIVLGTLQSAQPNTIQDILAPQRSWMDTRATTKIEYSDSDLIINYATNMLGTPYVWGAEGQRGAYDCSSWVRHVYSKAANIMLPRTAAEQATVGTKVDRDELQKGDLIFFKSRRKRIGHVGIYIEDGLFVHDSSSQGKVGYSDLDDSSYYDSHYVKAVRIIPEKPSEFDKFEADSLSQTLMNFSLADLLKRTS